MSLCEITIVHKTKEQREHNKTLFPNPNQNNNGSFVLRHLSPVHESLPVFLYFQIIAFSGEGKQVKHCDIAFLD